MLEPVTPENLGGKQTEAIRLEAETVARKKGMCGFTVHLR
jgi:hypothetical protein